MPHINTNSSAVKTFGGRVPSQKASTTNNNPTPSPQKAPFQPGESPKMNGPVVPPISRTQPGLWK